MQQFLSFTPTTAHLPHPTPPLPAWCPSRVPWARYGVYSSPICVLSKRKTGERVVATQIRHDIVRATSNDNSGPLSTDISRSLKSLSTQLGTLSRSLDNVVARLTQQVWCCVLIGAAAGAASCTVFSSSECVFFVALHACS